MTPAGKGQIKDRDLEVLGYVLRHGAVLARHVHREFFGDEHTRSAYRRLEVLENHGLIEHERIFYRKPAVYWATRRGAEWSRLGLRPYRPSGATLEHTLALVDFTWEIRTSGERWLRFETEREIRQVRDRGRIPDASLVVPPRRRVALELELTPKRTIRYRHILQEYAEDESFDEVRFYFQSLPAMERVRRLAAEYAGEGFFGFFGYDPR